MSRFVLMYDTTKNNQVMEFNSSAPDDYPTDEYLTERALTLAILISESDPNFTSVDAELHKKLFEYARNCRVVLTDGVVTDLVSETNPVQFNRPVVLSVEEEIEDLKTRLAALEEG